MGRSRQSKDKGLSANNAKDAKKAQRKYFLVPMLCVGMRTELAISSGMRYHAGAWEREGSTYQNAANSKSLVPAYKPIIVFAFFAFICVLRGEYFYLLEVG